MLPETFTFLPGVGEVTNKKILNYAKNWDEFICKQEIPCISAEKKTEFDQEIIKAKNALEALNPSYFGFNLPRHERWRLMPHFKDKLVYLDIETTGLSPEYSHTTVVGIHHSGKTKLFVKDMDLDGENIAKEIAGKIPVTFNGSRFDLPFLKSEFPALSFEIDIDLRFVCARLGLYGGLKKIEQSLGIIRNQEVQGMDGYQAVLLWKDWKRNGNKESLAKLLDYNRHDVDNLITLGNIIYGKMLNCK